MFLWGGCHPCLVNLFFKIIARMKVPDFCFLFRNDESNFFNSPQELMDAFKEIIEERIEPKLLTIFHSKPAAQLEIVEVTSTLPTSVVLFSVHSCMSHLFIFLLFLFAFC
jgi:hypothetical protein